MYKPEEIWREKSDDDLLHAAANLDDFTLDMQEAIRSELGRRGLAEPVEQVGGSAAEDLPMSEAERIWRQKSDEDLLEAAASLDDFTEEGQRAVRGELKRRGLEDPLEQAGEAALAEAVPEDDKEPATRLLDCVRCQRPLESHGIRTLVGPPGRLFDESEAVEAYVCPKCGHVELFVTAGEAEDDQ